MADDRGLIITALVLITFLGSWVIVVGSIPPDFYVTSPEYTPYDYPDYFTQQDIESMKYFIEHNLTWTTFRQEYDFDALGATGTYIKASWGDTYEYPKACFFEHETFRFWFFSLNEDMYFQYKQYDQRDLPLNLIMQFWDSSMNVSRMRPISAPDISITVYFADSNSSRQNFTQAWDEGKILVGIGFGLDDWQAKYDSWTLVGKLLTFQAPEIHPILNALIAIPFWVATVMCVILIIVKFIPFTSS